MIPFRQHVVSLIAVFLALAVGVILGGGPLSEVDRAVTQSMSTDEPDAQVRATADFADTFAGEASDSLLADRLADRQVAVVTLPGADTRTVDELAGLVETAGGTVSARYALTETMLDPSEKSLVDTLGSQLAEQQPDGAVAADATTYPRAGMLLGRAIATTEEGSAEADSQASGAIEGMIGADLVTAPDEPAARAPLVLVVLGDEPSAEGGDAIVGGLLEGLADASVGTVAVGTLADGAGGQLERLRAAGVSDVVATVDGTDTAAGRAAAVLTLARTFDETGGSFGASGSDGAAPLG